MIWLAASPGLAVGFPLGWLTARTWYRFDAGLRDELRAIDEEREKPDEDA